MINIRPNKNSKTMQGAALLVFIVILLLSVTMLVFSLAKSGIYQQKMTGNEYRSTQAFEAAQAGLSFGIVYLNNNKSTIVKDANLDGYIDNYSDVNTSNVVLANGSKYTVSYSNPIRNNFLLIQVTSDGVSPDGVSVSEAKEQVYFSPMLYYYSNYPLYAKGNVSMAGNSSIVNTTLNNTIITGGTTNFSGSSNTILNSGKSSYASHILGDVAQNNATLSSMSLTSFFTSIFGASVTTIENSVAHYYSNGGNTDYSSTLNGMQNTSIWIDQTSGQATIGSNTVIGSTANPVILIVNGDLKLSGSAQIYGLVYVSGNLQSANTVSVAGGMVVGGNVTDSGNFTLTYNASILSSLQQNIGSFSKVAGSWNDFQQ